MRDHGGRLRLTIMETDKVVLAVFPGYPGDIPVFGIPGDIPLKKYPKWGYIPNSAQKWVKDINKKILKNGYIPGEAITRGYPTGDIPIADFC